MFNAISHPNSEGREILLDRRKFIETLSVACLTTGKGLAGRYGILMRPGRLASSPESVNSSEELVPIPASVGGLRASVVELPGTWLFAPVPPAEFWKSKFDTSNWLPISVPCEFAMHGFEISQDVEYPCRKTIRIPSEFANHRIFIRFDGVYSFARVWVNGTLVRSHTGGFTSWDAEITDHVEPGSSAELVVGVTDQSGTISQGTIYAKHPMAGMIRGVRMFAVPRCHLSDLSVTASYAKNQTGAISLEAAMSSPELNSAGLRFTLKDSSGQTVAMEPARAQPIFADHPLAHELRVPSAKPWDAEHPNLYRLEVALMQNGQIIEKVERSLGFRTVERFGNQLLVNGHPVRLHGVCRHSIHPIHGRAVPPEFDEIDASLLREANVNFVRTSHYPPTEAFLDACDRHGIYIEEETAVCWSGAASSNSGLQEEFLSQLREMITRDRHHPCVLFWSLGNESDWGSNFAAEKQYTREHDPTRPTIFSYPDSVPAKANGYDIYSKHYADVHSDLSSRDYPLLNDEFAHVSCYNLETLRRDPGVRNFWGESIKQFAEKFFAADGCLGGSIWAGIDEVFLLPSGPIGYGEWGIIDGWRRRKPEHWLTRKAYSPIRIDQTSPLRLPERGNPLVVPVGNAFDHTNLNEVEIRWAVGSESGQLPPVYLAPHKSGLLEVPAHPKKPGEKLQLDFRANGFLVEQVELEIGEALRPTPQSPGGKLTCIDRVNDYLITGGNFSVVVSKETGLVAQAWWNDMPVLQGGPFLDLGAGPISAWKLTRLEVKEADNRVFIFTHGESKEQVGTVIPVELEMKIDSGGEFTTRYRADVKAENHPNLGIAYLVPHSFDKLAWKRKVIWSKYPEDHIGRPEGVAISKADHPRLSYREQPTWPWSQDTDNFFLWGKSGHDAGATNDFRSLKPNIWWANLGSSTGSACVHIEADADVAVRASILTGAVCLSVYNYWSYPDLAWGNYLGLAAAPTMTTHEIKMWLVGEL